MSRIIKQGIALAKRRFCDQRCSSRSRLDANKEPIQWKLTFEEWYSIWISSGHYAERGRGHGKYCMSRKNDIGPYSIDNVEIKLHVQNHIEGIKGKPSWNKGLPAWNRGVAHTEETKRKIGLANSKPKKSKETA